MNIDIMLEKEDMVYIHGTIHNKDLYDILLQKEEPERVDAFNNIIETGTMAVKSCLIKDRIDYIKKEFIEFLPKITENIGDILKEKSTRQEAISEELKLELIKMIDQKISLLNNNINDTIRADIVYRMNNIEKSIDEQKTWRKALSQTTRKGTEFEIRLYNYLQDIARPLHDNVTDTRNKPGEFKNEKDNLSNKGDFVITNRLIPFRFVIEAKSHMERSDMDITKAENYMEESLKNRDAKFIIMVFEDNIPHNLKDTSFIGTNKLICNLDGLQTAYYNARAYIQDMFVRKMKYRKTLDDKNKDRITEITKTQVMTEIKGVLAELNNIKVIESNIELMRRDINGTVNKTTESLKDNLSALYNKIRSRLVAIDNVLEILNPVSSNPQEAVRGQEIATEQETIDQKLTEEIATEQETIDQNVRIETEYEYIQNTDSREDSKRTKRIDTHSNNTDIESSWGR